MTRSKRLQRFFNDLSSAWTQTQPNRLSAALAYYSMFSLAPVIFIALTVAGIFINEDELMALFFSRLATVVGQETAVFLADLVSGISVAASGSSLASLISLGALLYAATGLFFHLQYCLNTIWRVPPEEQVGIINMIKNRLLAFVMVIGLGVVFAILVVASLLTSFISSLFDLDLSSFGLANILILLAVQFVALVLIYKFIPQVRVGWRDVWLGAILTAIALNVAALAVSIYLSISNVTSAFEAAGTLAVLLIAIYYASQIFLFGAMFTQVYSRHFGTRVGQSADNGALAEPA